MAGLLFGTGGTPHSAKSPSTIDGIERIAELGLGCMEIEFVQGVRMSEEIATLVGKTAAKAGVKLSAHAPYFINLNAHEPEKIKASQERLLQTARIASLCHAESIVFHAAFYLGDSPEKAYSTIKKNLEELLTQLKREDNQVWIRPETTGKPSQFGTLEEILDLCTELEGVAPCLDFAHWHARTGGFNSYHKFASILLQVKNRLGRDALDNMHIHVSGITYGKKGETKHLNLKESDFQYTELLRALKDYDAKGIVICESPNLEEDALLLQATYNTLLKTD
ncbi:MAG: deoxyribonuclease IV [Dehalococcoidales bacterium]|nr:deoxyribonuclease IV [Dehalococcoidales bacterium]